MSDARRYVIGTIVAAWIATSCVALFFANIPASRPVLRGLYILANAASLTGFLLGYAGMGGDPSKREALILCIGEASGLIVGFLLIALFVADNLLFARIP